MPFPVGCRWTFEDNDDDNSDDEDYNDINYGEKDNID